MLPDQSRILKQFLLPVAILLLALPIRAGGPRIVAGSTFFDPAQKGHPVLWSGGLVRYFTDRGPLGATVSNSQANAMVAAAAAAWSNVPTAAVSIVAAGSLAEDVSGQNVTASANGVVLPPDVQETATNIPVAVIYDADGAVIDALYGLDASNPDDCVGTGAAGTVDNLAPAGTIVHAWIVLNGRCTGTAAQLQQLQFQTMRAFGRILGLDWSQANDAVLSSVTPPSLQQLQGWPIMRPIDLYCNQLSTECVPQPLQLRPDDTAAISRLYPVTSANLGQFPARQLTASTTISIHGNVYFRRGQGMQGVNLVARPIDPHSGQPQAQYATAAVAGALFTGDRGNAISGTADPSGRALSDFGSDDPLLQGTYDLSGLQLPPGQTTADYQLTLEAVNPLYTGAESVGPYRDGSPSPSGTMPILVLHGLTAGASLQQDITVADSASDLQGGSGGSLFSPATIPLSGEWAARLAAPGATSWFALPVLGGRHLTVEIAAIDQAGLPAQNKLRPLLGAWNGSLIPPDPPTNATTAPFNAVAGNTALGIDAIADGELLLAVADQRGDGRPDYTYRGRLLYAANVTPSHLPLTGGHIRIDGSGFRPGMVVTLGTNITASIDQLTSNLILASAPSVSAATGSLDLSVQDPATNGIAVIAAGVSYGAASADTLTLITAPPPTLAIGAFAPFTVQVLGPDQATPVGGVAVAFSVLQGSGTFDACGASTCVVVNSGDGFATIGFSPRTASAIRLQASLPGGATLAAELTGTLSPSLTAITPSLFLAPGAAFTWKAQVNAVSSGAPVPNAAISWQGGGALSLLGGTSITNSQGLAGFVFPSVRGVPASVRPCKPA